MAGDDQFKAPEQWGQGPHGGGFYHLMAGETPDVILARIDERTKNLVADVAEIKQAQRDHYVTREEFANLKEKVALNQKIVFGTVGLICITVLGAVLKIVVTTGVHHP